MDLGSAPKRKKGGRTDPAITAQWIALGHAVLAGKLEIPELALEPPEAMAIAVAVSDLTEYYAIEISKPVQLALNLIGALGMVYMPRFPYIVGRLRERKARKAGNVGTVNHPGGPSS